MSKYAAGKEPPCPAKLPGCLGVIKERSAKQCSNCYDFSRRHQLRKPAKERLRLEDKLRDEKIEHLRASVVGQMPTLAPAIVNKKHSTAHEMVLLLSDAHFSEQVDPEVAMGIAYNEDVCKRRIERVRDVTIRYKQLRESSYPIRKLTVAILGDMLSGDIHDELEITNESPLPVALVTLAYYLHDMGLSLRAEFPDVELVFIPGNHPRTKKIPRFKQKTTTNWEYVLGHMVKALAQKAYTVTVPKAMV